MNMEVDCVLRQLNFRECDELFILTGSKEDQIEESNGEWRGFIHKIKEFMLIETSEIK